MLCMGGCEYSQPLDPAWAGRSLSAGSGHALSGFDKLRQPGGWGSACMRSDGGAGGENGTWKGEC